MHKRNISRTPISEPNFPRRPLNNPKKQKSSFTFNQILIVFAVFLMLLLGYINATKDIIIPAGNFTIRSGETLRTLNTSQKLGIADWRYRGYLKFFGPDVTIKAGNYITEKDLPLEEFLTSGLKETVVVDNEQKITILPGWNIWDIDAYLTEK